MSRASQFAAGVRTFFGHVLTDPIRDGQIHPSQWHPALRILGAITLVTFLAALAHIIAAEEMRAHGNLVVAGPGLYLPARAMPMVAVGIFLSTTLLQTAALHLVWPLRILALVAGAATVGSAMVNSTSNLLYSWIAVGAFIALVLFHLVRIGRRFSTFEVVVVATLVFGSTQLPMLGSTGAFELGFETRGMVLTSQMQFMWLLAAPALATAGTALTQVAVTSGEAVGAVATRKLGVRLLQVCLGVLLLWRTWVVLTGFMGGIPELWIPDLLGALLALVVATAIAIPFIIRARRHGDTEVAGPGSLADAFGGVSFVLVALSTIWVILPTSLLTIPTLLVMTEYSAPDWLWDITGIVNHSLTPSVSRITAGVICLVWMWRRAGRGEWLGAVLVAAFLGPQVISLLNTVFPNSPFEISAGGLGVWLQVALLASTAVVAASRRVDRGRLGALLAAAAILTLHDFRHILENPVAAVIGFSALGALLFGMVWRVLTDGEFTQGDSRSFPSGSRVLLYLANIMFLTTVLTFSALTRDATGFFAVSVWEETGDTVFALPLWFSAVLIALWLAVANPGSRPDVTIQRDSMTASESSSNESSTLV